MEGARPKRTICDVAPSLPSPTRVDRNRNKPLDSMSSYKRNLKTGSVDLEHHTLAQSGPTTIIQYEINLLTIDGEGRGLVVMGMPKIKHHRLDYMSKVLVRCTSAASPSVFSMRVSITISSG
eukprot:145551-Amphidinium_carterae.1